MKVISKGFKDRRNQRLLLKIESNVSTLSQSSRLTEVKLQ